MENFSTIGSELSSVIPASKPYFNSFSVNELLSSNTEAMQTIIRNATVSNKISMNTIAFRRLGIMIGIFDILLGSCGNLLTILAIINNKKFHKPFYMFIANLCVIDFLTASAMMPFNVTSYYLERWPFGNDSITCSIMAFCYYCCGYSSIVCLLTITVNRFVGVVYPEKYPDLFTKRRIICIVITCWVFAPSFLAPIFFFTNNGYGWNSHQTLCVFNTKAFKQEELHYMQFNRVLFQFLPLVVMIILYILIFKKSKQCRQAVTNISLKVNYSCNSSKERQKIPGSSFENNRLTLKDLNSVCFNGMDMSPESHAKTSSVEEKLNDQIYHTVVKETKSNPVTVPASPQNDLLPQDKSNTGTKCNAKFGTSQSLHGKNLSSRSLHASCKASPRLQIQFCPEAIKSSSAPCSPTTEVGNITDSRSEVLTNSTPHLHSCYKRCPSQSHTHSWTSIFQSTSQVSSKGTKYSSVMQHEVKKRKLVDRRLLRISVTICSAFMILFLPSVIINLFKISDPRVHMCASFVTWFNSCVNPIIYCFMNDKMRYQYKILLLRAWNTIFPCMKLDEFYHLRAKSGYVNSTSKQSH